MSNEQHVELLATLGELLETSNNLKEALIKRDVNAINASSGILEKAADRLQTLQNHHNIQPSMEPTGRKNDEETRKAITLLVSKIKTVQRTNKAMASAFLTIINRTFMSICNGGNGTAGTYSASGNRDMNISPILVHQQG